MGRKYKKETSDWEVCLPGRMATRIYTGRLTVFGNGTIVITCKHGPVFVAQPGAGVVVRMRLAELDQDPGPIDLVTRTGS